VNLVRDSFHQPNVGIEDNMPITIQEKHLLDLLEETVPYLRFCVGGTDVEETLAKVEMCLQLAGRAVEDGDYEVSDRG